MLRKLRNMHIVCEPITECGRAGYRFTATGTFDRLLTGVSVVNCSGGGNGACLPILSEKSHTLTIMTNADRIGWKVAALQGRGVC